MERGCEIKPNNEITRSEILDSVLAINGMGEFIFESAKCLKHLIQKKM